MERDNRGAEENRTGSNQELQLVVFDLAAEYYGVDIGDVSEIIRMQAITQIPGAPAFVEGVINLRGKVVPVLDLRKRLDRRVKEQTKESRIVVVNIGSSEVGVIVDAVTEVLSVPMSSIEPPSNMITDVESDYLRGIAKLDSKLIILLDVKKALDSVHKRLEDIAQGDADTIAADSDVTPNEKAMTAGNGHRRKSGAAAR